MLSILSVMPVSDREVTAMDMKDKESIQLPMPRMVGKVSLEETLARRRSVRQFRDRPLTQQQLSQLLWAAQGISDQRQRLRTAPSAGALYPLEIYVVDRNGVFHYSPQNHTLTTIRKGDLRTALAGAALSQGCVARAPLSIVITAVYERTTRKYGQRGMRYVHIEVGHAGQNILLQAVALGLDAVPVGAFVDEQVSSVLGLPETHRPLYIIPVGYKM